MISIIIPANNEATLIGRCLEALLASNGPEQAEVIVVANGCSDDTARRAKGYENQFSAKGWTLIVLDLAEGGKPLALNAGDAAATGQTRVYLDADIEVSRTVINELDHLLQDPNPLYASGKMQIARANSWVSRAYGRIFARVPFMTKGVPGAGLFAVNAEGRKRWEKFPEIISDDTFVRLSFTPQERKMVPSDYQWPLVEGFQTLVKVRRRQDQGVAEIQKLYPDLLDNDDKTSLGVSGMFRLFVSDPIGFAVYLSVAVAVRMKPAPSTGWERGR